jgi:hypothetical protein
MIVPKYFDSKIVGYNQEIGYKKCFGRILFGEKLKDIGPL